MLRDERNLPVSTDSPVAVARLDRAVEHYLKFHADTGSLVNDALAADPDFVLAQTFKGYLLLAAANPANREPIARTLAVAQAAAPAATQREQWHVAAFAAWAQDAVDESFRIWRRILDEHPTDLMAVRICDTIWFRHGQTDAIREQADRLAPAWHDAVRGNDCFQSVWAFAHEETGDYAAAERAIDAALAEDRTNFFAHHVKAHVLEMDCRPREGRDWLAAQADTWSIGNNLIHHLWWHRALMRLDLGETEEVLADYDAHIRNFSDPRTRAVPDFYVDLQNAAALLWRLEQLGMDVGDRWVELADKAEARCGEAAHLLLVPHLMLALAATGRHAVADRYLSGLRELAGNPSLWTAPAIADVVIPVCEAVLAHRRGDYARAVDWLEPCYPGFRPLGGSNAQRDMFTQMLLDAAVRAGRREIVAAMIAHETATRAVPPVERSGYAAAARWLG
jgi:tetratricopeptide (TPR) repeat protein